MSSGFIEIAALGQQDVYLTGTPDVTYFSSVYKRHTPFVLEAFEVPFKASSITMGQNNIVRIPAKGDLVRATTLKLTLPPLAVYGQDWFWPTISSDLPSVIITRTGLSPLGPYVIYSLGLQYFSSNTQSFNQWNSLSMTYDANINKFIFNISAYSGQSVGVTSAHATFFGFDVRNASSTDGTYFYYKKDSSGFYTPDFTLEQAGWTRNIGIPVNTLSGLFLNLERDLTLAQVPYQVPPYPMWGSSVGYINFSQNDNLGLLWTNYDTPAAYTITPGGRINFTANGVYTIRVYAPNSSIFKYGADSGDGIPNTFNFQNKIQTIGPLVTFPIIVTNNLLNYYFVIGTNDGTLPAGSYFSITPNDDVFLTKSPIHLTGSEPVVNFNAASNTTQPGGAGITPVSGGNFTITRIANWLISGSLGTSHPGVILNRINLYNDSGLYATYSFLGQEGNPTTTFAIPIRVDNSWGGGTLWHFTVITEPQGISFDIDYNSFITFTYLALPNGSPSGGDILPYNGLLFALGGHPDSGVFNNKYGVENMITIVDENELQFSNIGTYMVTAYLPDVFLPPQILPQFNQPSGIAFDQQGNRYFVADSGNNCIREVSVDGTSVSTRVGNGQPGFVDDFVTSAYFHNPQGIFIDLTVDPEFPRIYVADTGNHAIRKFNTEENMVITLTGNGTPGYVDGDAADARFNSPTGLCVDFITYSEFPRVYIADTGNHSIRMYDPERGSVVTIAGNGTAGPAVNGVSLTAARFRSPQGIARFTGEQGEELLYVSDTGNYCIRMIDITHNVVSIIAGKAGIPGHVDGYPGNFEYPTGISIDAQGGYLFISDGNYVRYISPTDLYLGIFTIAGSENSGYVDGTPGLFHSPRGLLINENDANVYICDSGNNVIRVVSISVSASTFSGNPATTFLQLDGTETSYQNSSALTVINIPVRATSNNFSYTLQVSRPSTVWPDGSFVWVYPITSTALPTDYSQYHYYDSVGTWAIESADLKIGGQSIQTLSGEYIEIWNDLNVPYENQPALTLLTGKYDTTIATGRDYYVNLPFYFYEKSQNYLPMCSLSRQDVEIHVIFRTLQALTAIPIAEGAQVQATLIVEYVYLDTPELNWFTKTRLEYVIDQAQYQEIDLAAGLTQDNFLLNFRNPVQAIFFAIQVNGALPYDWSNDGLQRMGLSFNGEEIMLNRITDATQLGVIEPFNNFINFPTRNFYMKTFKSPINFSRIRYVLLGLNIFRSDSYYPAKQLRITAVSKNVLQINDGLGGLMFISQ